jgi:hypothetical protein
VAWTVPRGGLCTTEPLSEVLHAQFGLRFVLSAEEYVLALGYSLIYSRLCKESVRKEVAEVYLTSHLSALLANAPGFPPEQRACARSGREVKAMPISGDIYKFTKKNVDNSPDNPGVYALWDSGYLIYYGRAQGSIRERLKRHLSGAEGSCTQGATGYQREETLRPVTREKELLDEFVRLNGDLPRCNERGA